MNWLDVLFIILLLLLTLNGFGNGLLRMLFDITGYMVVFIISLFCSRFLSGYVSGWFGIDSFAFQLSWNQYLGVDVAPEQMPNLFAGLIVFILLFVLLSFAFSLYSRKGFRWANRVPVIGLLNRAGGAVLGAGVGALIVYFIFIVLSIIPFDLFTGALDNSVLANYLEKNLDPYASEFRVFLVNFYL